MKTLNARLNHLYPLLAPKVITLSAFSMLYFPTPGTILVFLISFSVKPMFLPLGIPY
jgi:hypothetical protein